MSARLRWDRLLAFGALLLAGCDSWDESGRRAILQHFRTYDHACRALCGAPPGAPGSTGQNVDTVEVTRLDIKGVSDVSARGSARVRITPGADLRGELPPSCEGEIRFDLERSASRQVMFGIPGERPVTLVNLEVVARQPARR